MKRNAKRSKYCEKGVVTQTFQHVGSPALGLNFEGCEHQSWLT